MISRGQIYVSVLIRFLLFCGLVLTVGGCGVAIRGIQEGAVVVKNSEVFHQGRHGALTSQEKDWAKIAWKYFQNNLSWATGLVNSVDDYPTATMWHVGDGLAALVAARELEIIDDIEFDARLSSLLQFLNTMPLFRGKVPNTAYHTGNGQMIHHDNTPGETGWSAVDLGRALVWLRIVREHYPRFSEYIDRVILRWNFCDVIDSDGALYGATVEGDKVRKYEAGQSGYEKYIALGFQTWGWTTDRASRGKPSDSERIFDVEVLRAANDMREEKGDGKPAPVVTLPYVLDGLEFNWDTVDDSWSLDSMHTDPVRADLAQRIYTVQERRYAQKKIFTARTDHKMSGAPYFVYDSIFAGGYAWNTISDEGKHLPGAALVSSRAGFGMWALWKTNYTDELLPLVSSLFDANKGWLEGRFELTGGYERTVTATTNAIVLESLLYKVMGKLYKLAAKDGYYQVILNDEFTHPGRCLPLDQTRTSKTDGEAANQ